MYVAVASTRVQGWVDEPCEPTVHLPDWSELVASYSRMKSAWGWANGGQPILVCYIRKYVIILAGIFPLTSPQPKYWGDVSPASPSGLMPVVRRQCSILYSRDFWGKLQRLLPNPNALVAVSKGMQAAELCTNKILQFLTGGACKLRLTLIMAVKKVVVVVVVYTCALCMYILLVWP